MIEKPKRPKKIPNQDNKQPQTIQELIRRYDLDNTKIYDFLDELAMQINSRNTQHIKIHNEIEAKITETVLYENQTGTTEDITLTESAENFSYIEIFYKSSYNQCSSVKVYSPNNKHLLLSSFNVFQTDGTVVGQSRVVTISETNISTSGEGKLFGEWWSWDNSIKSINRIYITRVVGYR